MKRSLLLIPCAAGLLLLAACSGTPPASPLNGNDTGSQLPVNESGAQLPNDGSGSQNFGQSGRPQGMNRQNLQQYAAEADAAPDKTVLTKDQFTAEMQTLRAAMQAQFQAQNPGGQPRSGGPRFGSGSMRGRGGPNGGAQSRLATAVTFLRYTDPSGQEVLLALDGSGQVVMKWPPALGFGRPGSGTSSSQG